VRHHACARRGLQGRAHGGRDRSRRAGDAAITRGRFASASSRPAGRHTGGRRLALGVASLVVASVLAGHQTPSALRSDARRDRRNRPASSSNRRDRSCGFTNSREPEGHAHIAITLRLPGPSPRGAPYLGTQADPRGGQRRRRHQLHLVHPHERWSGRLLDDRLRRRSHPRRARTHRAAPGRMEYPSRNHAT
jgi:hypothetical protein